jgi:hypothetical protein
LLEANDKQELANGLRALEIRVARALNTISGRSGNVFTDRYHARALKKPASGARRRLHGRPSRTRRMRRSKASKNVAARRRV